MLLFCYIPSSPSSLFSYDLNQTTLLLWLIKCHFDLMPLISYHLREASKETPSGSYLYPEEQSECSWIEIKVTHYKKLRKEWPLSKSKTRVGQRTSDKGAWVKVTQEKASARQRWRLACIYQVSTLIQGFGPGTGERRGVDQDISGGKCILRTWRRGVGDAALLFCPCSRDRLTCWERAPPPWRADENQWAVLEFQKGLATGTCNVLCKPRTPTYNLILFT